MCDRGIRFVGVERQLRPSHNRGDGGGFDPGHKGAPEQADNWGLLTMAERAEAAGRHSHVESAPDGGTRVIVEVRR
jgi:signal transduction histidine kinase